MTLSGMSEAMLQLQTHPDISGASWDQCASCPHCVSTVLSGPAHSVAGVTQQGVEHLSGPDVDRLLLQLWVLPCLTAWESGHMNPSCMGRKRGHKAEVISTRPFPPLPALCLHGCLLASLITPR